MACVLLTGAPAVPGFEPLLVLFYFIFSVLFSLLASDDKPCQKHAHPCPSMPIHAPPLSCNTYQRGRSKTLRGGGTQKKEGKKEKEASNSVHLAAENKIAFLRFQPCKIRIRIADGCSRRWLQKEERGTGHPIVPETRWKAWEGRSQPLPSPCRARCARCRSQVG